MTLLIVDFICLPTGAMSFDIATLHLRCRAIVTDGGKMKHKRCICMRVQHECTSFVLLATQLPLVHLLLKHKSTYGYRLHSFLSLFSQTR